MPIPAAAEDVAQTVSCFGSLLPFHLEDLRTRQRSLSAQKLAQTVLPLFFSHLREEGVTDLRQVSEAEIVSFARSLALTKTKRRGEAFTLASQRAYLVTVRSFFAFLLRRRWILRDPARGVPLMRSDACLRAGLTEAEARRLMSAPSYPRSWMRGLETRDKAILEVLYGTAIRLSECVRLDIQDLDLFHGTLFVRDGKGRKDRMAPLGAAAQRALGEYLRDARPRLVKNPGQAALFLTIRGGKRLSPVATDQLIRRHALAARIPHVVSAHRLRHACATHLIQGGADVRQIQEILGHKDIAMTARYTRVLVHDMRRMIEKAHPRERLWARQALQSRVRSKR